ncbi:hypothetical protein ACFOQM_13765 [Paenibacillus sp. GCM10012307]|uniref:Helix-turn-helix conjugative transposon-like domain-containing protein n=1 Tax=Paenibacillus roseus TaxID=2798579 RepID=A0A934J013_9BACL|nr:hypothetical protein [Paenibacillus roseus]MBJ6362357.1 hypothetical protein [Paenibacillus roseus]
MEAKNDSAIIPDREFLALLHAAREDDEAAKLQLIELFKKDIIDLSRFIHLPQEDAVSEIVMEILAYIKDCV